MINNYFKNFLKIILPYKVINYIKYYKDRKDILNQKSILINTSLNLNNFSFLKKYNNKDFQEFINNRTFNFHISKKSESISIEDQFILNIISKNAMPNNILEIGTFIGASSYIISKTLNENYINHHIDTVDIIDVNSLKNKNYIKKNFSIDNTPDELFKKSKLEKYISYFKSGSVNFFKKYNKKYDLIFIDGSHKARDAYFDVVNAINSINHDGIILIHDYYNYYNKNNPKKILTFGPCLALNKLIRENKNIKIIEIKNILDFLPYTSMVGLVNVSN